MHGCLECGKRLTKIIVDRAYRYDSGTPIQLRSISRWSCSCGYYEDEIPKMGPLHAAIAQALEGLNVKRGDLAFRFEEGSLGVTDGTWRATA